MTMTSSSAASRTGAIVMTTERKASGHAGWLVLLTSGVIATLSGWAWLASESPPSALEPLVEPPSGPRDALAAGAEPSALPELAPLPELLPVDTTPAQRAPRARPDVVSRASRR